MAEAWLTVQHVQADMPQAVLRGLQQARAQAGEQLLPLVVAKTQAGDVVILGRDTFEAWYGDLSRVRSGVQPSMGCMLTALPEREED